MRERARKFLASSKWEQMNRNPAISVIKQEIKNKFSLSDETSKKRKFRRDTNMRARKKNTTHDEREITRLKALDEFTSPESLHPTAFELNYKEHIGRD
jgi:hypothetical protein